MKDIRNLQDENCPTEIKQALLEFVRGLYAGDDDYDDDDFLKDDLLELTGCSYHIVETIEDFSKILTSLYSEEKCGYLSIMETAAVFDTAEKRDFGYIELFQATNNGGGPCWFIPESLATLCPNVENSIRLTKHYWDAH